MKLSKIHRKRLWLLAGFAVLAISITSLVMFALKRNINLFYTPTEIKQASATLSPQVLIRVGGMVTQGSLQYLEAPATSPSMNSAATTSTSTSASTAASTSTVMNASPDRHKIHVRFSLQDTQAVIPIHYSGVLPDLFREGQGVVVQGYWQNGQFQAVQVLAKHDENYMPPGVRRSSAISSANAALSSRANARDPGNNTIGLNVKHSR